jgi:membrane protease YdiL (CAAX protease family)
MIKTLLQTFYQFFILFPLILFSIEKNKKNIYRIILFSFCFIFYQLIEEMQRLYQAFDFIKSSWNWDGKILGILFGLICFFIFKNKFIKYNFFKIRQERENIKKTLVVSIIIIFITAIMWFILGESEFDIETLVFQLIIPGIDEEIMYRGVLLGLLMSCIKDKIFFRDYIGILIIAILFGFIHAFQLNDGYSIYFDWIYFIQTSFFGFVLGWITIKSRSILLAIIVHNLSNFLGVLVTMLK